MKKVVIILIIAAAVAVFALVAGRNDVFKSVETEKTAIEKKIEPHELKRDVKMPIKSLKIQRIKPIDKEKIKENIKKLKEKEGQNPDSPKNSESCGG